jgi:hypothetical protein
MCGTAMSEVKRYPLARKRTARNRDLLNARNGKVAVSRSINASVDS